MTNKKKKDHTAVIIIVIVALSILGYRYWDKSLKDKIIPKRFAAIEEGKLYRSGCIHERLIRGVLKEHNIQLIVSLMGQYPVEEQVADEMGISLREYRLDGDGTGDIEVYANALEDVTKSLNEDKPALIHCVSGTMRSGAFTAFYRMLIKRERDYKKITDEMKKYNWKTDQLELPDYMNRNMYTLASMLKERGVIDEIPNPLPQIQFPGVKIYTLDELISIDQARTATEEVKDEQPEEK